MILLKRTLIVGLILGVMSACGSAENSASNYVESGKALMAEGKIDKARLEFRNAIQIEPKTAEAYYQLALIDEKSQNWKGMFSNLSRVEQLAPTHYQAIVKLGQLNLLAGNFDIALEKASTVLNVDNQNVMAYVLRSSVSMKQENYGAAINDIEKALAIDPVNIEAISVKTLVLNLQGKPDQALAVLETALKEKPNELPLTMIKLSILEQQKDYAAMEAIYRGLLTSQPNADWVPVSLAKLLNVQNRYDEAKQVLSTFSEAHPEDAKAKLVLVSLVKTKEPQQAIALLDNYIAQDKDNYDLRLSKIQLLLATQQLDLAIVDLKELASLDPEGNSGRKAKVVLAQIELQKGDVKAAGEILNTVLATAPEDESALLLKARIDIMNKNIDTAVTNLRIVLRNNPESDEALVLLAQAYMNSGSSELADDNFRQALAVNPGNTVAALSVANSLMKTSDLNRTEDVLVKSLKQDPNNTEVLQALAQVRILKKDWLGSKSLVDNLKAKSEESALAYYLTARISQGQEYFAAAVDEYKSALALRPDMARALQGLAYSSLQLGQKEQLINYLNEFLQKNPTQLAAYSVLSNIYMQDKEWAKAVATIEQGIAKEPKWQGGYSALAAIYFAQNKNELAISAYQQGLDNNKNSNFLTLQMASAYERINEFDKAKALYEEVLARDASVEPAINNLASLLTEQFSSEENINKAMILAERFKTATEPYYLDTYAWTNFLKGDLIKAQGVLERVISLSPDIAVFNYHLGAVYLKQNNKLEAENYLNIAQSLAEKQGDKATAQKVSELLKTL